MDLNYLKKILKIFNDSGVNEIELEEEGLKISVKKSQQKNIEVPVYSSMHTSIPANMVHDQPSNHPHKDHDLIKSKEAEPNDDSKYHQVKSPIVGTFYMAPSPDAEAYVKVGDKVSPGTVLCIVEAMKLMNEIESDVEGKVIKILIENGKPVEYGQILFLIETT